MSSTSVIMILIGALCGVFFSGYGIFALVAKKPVSFWAGTKPDPERISDIPGYNRENGKMWLVYSVPYWLAAVAGAFNDRFAAASYLFLILLIVAGSAGLWWLLMHYQKIAGKYMDR